MLQKTKSSAIAVQNPKNITRYAYNMPDYNSPSRNNVLQQPPFQCPKNIFQVKSLPKLNAKQTNRPKQLSKSPIPTSHPQIKNNKAIISHMSGCQDCSNQQTYEKVFVFEKRVASKNVNKTIKNRLAEKVKRVDEQLSYLKRNIQQVVAEKKNILHQNKTHQQSQKGVSESTTNSGITV